MNQLECIVSSIDFFIQSDLVEFAKSKGWTDKEIAYLNVFGDEKFQEAEILLTDELLRDLGGKKISEISLRHFIDRQYKPYQGIILLRKVDKNSPIVMKYSHRPNLADGNFGNRKKFYVTNGLGLLHGLNLLGTDEAMEVANTGFKSMNLVKEYNRYVNSSKDEQIKILQQNYTKLELKHKHEVNDLTLSVQRLELSNSKLQDKVQEGNKRLSTAMLSASNPEHIQILTILKITLISGIVIFKILRTQKRCVASCIWSCKKVLGERDLDVDCVEIWDQIDNVQNSVELNTLVLSNLSLYKNWFDRGYRETVGSSGKGLKYYFVPDIDDDEGARIIMNLISTKHEYIIREL